ncbi:phage tail protein [Candidatus Poribacteria bacterium]|nr:phage tail protein [Candidatus Poribacteria bacterium]
MPTLIGEIKLFAGNFEPPGWRCCDGRLLAISEHKPLFEIIGNIYGGDGRTTFALPDLRGRIPMGNGVGPGLSARRIGESGGTENVTLSINQLAAHTHTLNAVNVTAIQTDPTGNVLANTGTNTYLGAATNVVMGSDSIGSTGNNDPIPNVQPFLAFNFIIAVQGKSPRDDVRLFRRGVGD